MKNAIIIGGGLAGTSAAAALAKRGWQVTIIERNGDIASEASGNPAGIISPMISHKNDLIGEFYLEGFNYTTSHYPYNKCGVLELGKQHKDLENLVIDKQQVRALAQDEASELCGVAVNDGGLFIENGGWVCPADICGKNIDNANIAVVYNSEVVGLERISNGWRVGDREAEIVIIANANAAKKFPQTNWLPLIPVRGQVTYLPAALSTKTILCYEGGYVTPQIDGVNYVGATFKRGADRIEVTEEEHEENLKNLESGIKNLDSKFLIPDSLKGRSAFRSTTPDRRPLIGAVPDYHAVLHDYADLRHGRKKDYPPVKYLDGLYVTTGHGSRGITSCPIGGELLAAMINNEQLPLAENIVAALSPVRSIFKKIITNK